MIGVGLAVLGLLGATWTVTSWWRQRPREGATWIRAARRLGIERAERRLLRRLAQRVELRTPTALLVSRGAFDAAVVRAQPRGGDRTRLARIRGAVFEDG
jgi:hypothetical protein